MTSLEPNSFQAAKLLESGSRVRAVKTVSACIFFIICSVGAVINDMSLA